MLNDDALALKKFKAISAFINFKKDADHMIQRVFDDQNTAKNFTLQINSAIEGFLNIDSNLIAEYLAKWLDYNLKQPDDSILNIVDDTVTLLKLLKAKDIFEEFYMRGLSRRLLLRKSTNTETEKAIIDLIKIECSG